MFFLKVHIWTGKMQFWQRSRDDENFYSKSKKDEQKKK